MQDVKTIIKTARANGLTCYFIAELNQIGVEGNDWDCINLCKELTANDIGFSAFHYDADLKTYYIPIC